METGSKGNKVDVNTFKKWGKDDNIIGHKTIEDGGRNAQYLLLIYSARNLIYMCDRPLAPNFKRERPVGLLQCKIIVCVSWTI